MAFYPLLTGSVEVRIDRREPRPDHRVEPLIRFAAVRRPRRRER